MWYSYEERCCSCKRESRVVIDHAIVTKRTCSECGLDLCYYSIEPYDGYCDDFLSLSLGNSYTRGSHLVTTKERHPFYDFLSLSLENWQNCDSDLKPDTATSDNLLFFDLRNSQDCIYDPLSKETKKQNQAEKYNSQKRSAIEIMSDRLGLLETVKNQAIKIFKQGRDQTKGERQNVLFAACIYVACRVKEMPLTIDEVISVSDGASRKNLTTVAKSIAGKLGLDRAHLMNIKAADFIKRFCSTLEMDGQVVKAGQEAADKYTEISTKSRPPVTVAAVVIYVIARVSFEKKLLKGIVEATGVSEMRINETYKEMYPHLSKITPQWYAKPSDLKKLGSS